MGQGDDARATRGGKSYEALYFPPMGTPENPMTVYELQKKYRECAEWGGLTKDEIEKSMALIVDLEKLRNVGDLMRILQ